MGYCLGVDVGTTYTAAGVWRDGRSEIVSLGNRASTIPSVVFLRDDETLLTGEAAERRGATEPGRLAREFKRRIGDPTPIIVGGTPYSAEALTAKLLRWVLDKVTEREGAAPDRVTVSHPANWGPYKQDLLGQAIRFTEMGDATTLTEPEAAAIHYASRERIEVGSVVAVYDLGGGTFDAAVLRKADPGFEILGEPEGIERLGGVDFDEAVFANVTGLLGGTLDELDRDDATSMAAVARLRQECIAAKEALSSDTETSIPVLLPNLQTEVRLTRSEFEAMIRPALGDSIAALNRALRSAGVERGDVDAVLLVGGSSRIPLVAQLVSSEIGRPVAIDAHPKHAIALGAAIHARRTRTDAPVVAPATSSEDPTATSDGHTPPTTEPTSPPSPAIAGDGNGWPPGDGRDGRVAAGEPDRTGRPGLRGGLIAAGVVLLVAVVVGLTFFTGGDEQPVGAAATEAPDDAETAEAAVRQSIEPTEDLAQAGGAAASPTPPESEAPDTEFARIQDVTIEGDRYRVSHDVFNFEPAIADGRLHIHFFLDTTAPEDAGTNGDPPGDWHLTDEPSSFLTKYGPGNRGSATELCAVVATASHAVFDPESGNCVELPER